MILSTGKLNAQTEKGTLLLGGGFTLQVTEGSAVAVFNPNLGYFFINNVAAGGQFTVILADDYTAWSIGPFIRGYFLGSEKGKFFAQGGFNIGGESESDIFAGFNVGAGYAFFLNRSTALEISANYFNTEGNGLLSFGVGFQIHFKK